MFFLFQVNGDPRFIIVGPLEYWSQAYTHIHTWYASPRNTFYSYSPPLGETPDGLGLIGVANADDIDGIVSRLNGELTTFYRVEPPQLFETILHIHQDHDEIIFMDGSVLRV